MLLRLQHSWAVSELTLVVAPVGGISNPYIHPGRVLAKEEKAAELAALDRQTTRL